MTSLIESVPPGHKSGYVALIGKPNVGKSTLTNALLGHKMSIVTRKPQTTRHKILGILSDDDYQMIFLDTPGILEPKYKLHEAMMHNVHNAISDADLLLFIVPANEVTPQTEILKLIDEKPTILLINKTDLVGEREALPVAEIYSRKHRFEAIVPISALHGHNLDRVLELIVQNLPEGPPFYPKDIVSEHPERFFVAEIIREKIFELYSMEIPYSTQVNIIMFKERPDKKDLIDAEIIVDRPSQKGILIGRNGRALKRVGIAARQDIEAFLDREVFLQLHVKVREGWRNTESLLSDYGYDKPA